MNLFEILKQFKNIRPDSNFSEISKRAVLAGALAETGARRTPRWTAQWTLLRILEAGAAVALTGFFILIVAGGLTGSKLAPIDYSAIDPRGIRAEAQAIDIQIQLANVIYRGSSVESTIPIVKVNQPSGAKPPVPSPFSPSPSSSIPAPASSSPEATSGEAKATTSIVIVPTITINQALEGLSH